MHSTARSSVKWPLAAYQVCFACADVLQPQSDCNVLHSLLWVFTKLVQSHIACYPCRRAGHAANKPVATTAVAVDDTCHLQVVTTVTVSTVSGCNPVLYNTYIAAQTYRSCWWCLFLQVCTACWPYCPKWIWCWFLCRYYYRPAAINCVYNVSQLLCQGRMQQAAQKYIPFWTELSAVFVNVLACTAAPDVFATWVTLQSWCCWCYNAELKLLEVCCLAGSTSVVTPNWCRY